MGSMFDSFSNYTNALDLAPPLHQCPAGYCPICCARLRSEGGILRRIEGWNEDRCYHCKLYWEGWEDGEPIVYVHPPRNFTEHNVMNAGSSCKEA